jgi:energy-coupling factor transporter ATP-binding protein EcfA2
MATRIERIEMSCFRGATTSTRVDLDPSKPLALIYGENGAGKSTLVDAIDFVFNEAYGSLNDRSSTKPKVHIPSLGSPAASVEVAIVAGGMKWTGRLAANGPNTMGSSPRPDVTVLRRSQVLQFVNEAPRKRYEALRFFIALPGIEASEASLRTACKLKAEEYRGAVNSKDIANESLMRLWAEEGRPDKSPMDWAKSQIAKDSSSLQRSVSTLDGILRAFEAATAAHERLRASGERLEPEMQALSTAELDLKRIEEEADDGASSLISLLEETERFLKGRASVNACPVCESSEQTADLKDHVGHRLSAMKNLVAAKRAVDEAKRQVEQLRTLAADAEKAFAVAVRAMWLANTATLSKGSGVTVDPSHYEILRGESPELCGSSALAEAESLWRIVDGCWERIAARRDRDQKSLNQLNAISGYFTTVEAKGREANRLEGVSKRLNRLLEIVEGHRKRYVDNVLGSIEGLVEQMYSKVHPGEGLGGIRLHLKPNVAGSLEFESQFQGKSGVPPQAYYSDSHLDTLGICVFLALARHFNKDNSVVVLDDVITSADSNHLDRLIDLLLEEAEHLNQLIVTTHHRPWFERFRQTSSSKLGLIELGPWSRSAGIRPKRPEVLS